MGLKQYDDKDLCDEEYESQLARELSRPQKPKQTFLDRFVAWLYARLHW